MRLIFVAWTGVFGLLAGCSNGDRNVELARSPDSADQWPFDAPESAEPPAPAPEEGDEPPAPPLPGERGVRGPLEVTEIHPEEPLLPSEPAAIPSVLDRFRGTISRDDDRYPERVETIDGIVVKLEDTDSSPAEADLTIRVGRYKLKRSHVRTGEAIYGRGLSGRTYRIVLEQIRPKSESVVFIVEAVVPGEGPERE